MQFEVWAEDGPAMGFDHAVDRGEGEDWPAEAVFTTGPGEDERHLYRFKIVATGPEGPKRIYSFVRTLAPGEL
jgi:hypothetical protein